MCKEAAHGFVCELEQGRLLLWEAVACREQGLTEALRKHGEGLSLPPDATKPEEVIPAELRHKLWLQACFDDLSGLGQEPEINLIEQAYRIPWFIKHLRKHKDSVGFLGLTLESLLKLVIMPDADQQIFIKKMRDQLGIQTTGELILDHL